MDSICLAVGALILGIIAYLLWKRPLRGAHVQRDPTLVQPVGSYDPGSDSFYCIFCDGGTTRSGNIPDDR